MRLRFDSATANDDDHTHVVLEFADIEFHIREDSPGLLRLTAYAEGLPRLKLIPESSNVVLFGIERMNRGRP